MGLLAVYFFALMVQSLLERELRRAMESEGVESLPIYPEGRACAHPTARQVLDVFAPLSVHTLLVSDSLVSVTSTATSHHFNATCSSCSAPPPPPTAPDSQAAKNRIIQMTMCGKNVCNVGSDRISFRFSLLNLVAATLPDSVIHSDTIQLPPPWKITPARMVCEPT